MAPSKTMSSRLGPADAESERKRRRASEDHAAEARFCADQMIELMRPMQASRAAFIEATKDHYLLIAIDDDAFHVKPPCLCSALAPMLTFHPVR